jgi:hypothetical protein
MENLTYLAALAKELGMERSNLRQYVLKKGIRYSMTRDPVSRQIAMTFTSDEADRLRSIRAKEGFTKTDTPICINGEVGEFYVVQLIPELAHNRLKLGFSNNVGERLVTHRCSSPTAILLATWGCKRSWERAAMDSATLDCTLIANEVYECDSSEGVIKRLDTFFAIMPKVRE